jgi:hypothetical protein
MGYLVRYDGRWVEIHPRPFEPERQTTDVAWLQVKQQHSPAEAYRHWVYLQRKLSRIFQQ